MDVDLFAEAGVNRKVKATNRFSSWFDQGLEKVKCVAACIRQGKNVQASARGHS